MVSHHLTELGWGEPDLWALEKRVMVGVTRFGVLVELGLSLTVVINVSLGK